jgi:hypothetical protein
MLTEDGQERLKKAYPYLELRYASPSFDHRMIGCCLTSLDRSVCNLIAVRPTTSYVQ